MLYRPEAPAGRHTCLIPRWLHRPATLGRVQSGVAVGHRRQATRSALDGFRSTPMASRHGPQSASDRASSSTDRHAAKRILTFSQQLHVIILCSNSTRTSAARAMRPILPGLAVTCWSVFQRGHSAKPRSPSSAPTATARRGPASRPAFDPGGFFTDGTRDPRLHNPDGQHRHGVQNGRSTPRTSPGRGQVRNIARQHIRNP